MAKIKQKIKDFYILGAIDDDSLTMLEELEELSQNSPDTLVRVHMCSEGGQEPVGWALFDKLKTIKNTIETYGFGQISSIAALIFQAGDTRYIAPNATYMIHRGSVNIDSSDVTFESFEKIYKTWLENNEKYHKKIWESSSYFSPNDRTLYEKIVQFSKDESYLDASTLLKLGLVDNILR